MSSGLRSMEKWEEKRRTQGFFQFQAFDEDRELRCAKDSA